MVNAEPFFLLVPVEMSRNYQPYEAMVPSRKFLGHLRTIEAYILRMNRGIFYQFFPKFVPVSETGDLGGQKRERVNIGVSPVAKSGHHFFTKSGTYRAVRLMLSEAEWAVTTVGSRTRRQLSGPGNTRRQLGMGETREMIITFHLPCGFRLMYQ